MAQRASTPCAASTTSEDYVTVTLDTGKAVTIEEEQAAIKAAEEKKAAEEAKKNASVSAEKKSSSGQSASSRTTQNASIAASADEETLLAALVQCEAGGTSVQCMTAVGAVVVNRVRSGGFANSIYGVIYQRGQFGPASSGRLEARLASGVSASARQAARAALNGSDRWGKILQTGIQRSCGNGCRTDCILLNLKIQELCRKAELLF